MQDLIKQLDYGANEVARRLINDEINESAAVQWLQKYAVMEPARAQQRVKFIQRYRSYVINYNLGEDMVRRYIEKRSGTDPEKRWRIWQASRVAAITKRIARKVTCRATGSATRRNSSRLFRHGLAGPADCCGEIFFGSVDG